MLIYNKLVRDHIPRIIEEKGKKLNYRILATEDYKKAIKQKLTEEINEYKEAKTHGEAVEELADILELIHAAAKIHGTTTEQLEEVRRLKAEKRGGFEKRIFLIEVEDD